MKHPARDIVVRLARAQPIEDDHEMACLVAIDDILRTISGGVEVDLHAIIADAEFLLVECEKDRQEADELEMQRRRLVASPAWARTVTE